MNFLVQYKGFPKQIYLLCISRTVISMGIMFVFPFMSLLLTSRLGFTPIQTGYIMIFNAVGNMLGSLIGGKLADTVGRKKVYAFFTMIVVCTMFAGGFLCTQRIVVVFILIGYFAISAIMPVVSAMILDWSTREIRTESFSLLYLSSNIGSSIGPIIAGLLFYRHMPLIFFGMSFAFLITFIITALKVEENFVPTKTETERKAEESLAKIVWKRPVLLIFVICLAVLTICYIQLDYMLPMQFRDTFGLNLGSKYSSLIWTINGLVVVLFTPVLISLTKKNHQIYNIFFSCIIYAVGFSFYGLTQSLPVYLMAVVVWTSGEILISTGASVYIADQSPETHRGRAMSLYEFSRGIGRCFGPVLCGYFLSSHTYSQSWLLSSCICLVISVIMVILYRKSKKK